ncbi:hypothetical protein DV096_19550 [Bradymonadaceae bacterium TMQ3]|nr:hypothetical protein DV096_19550 [Bradymonadaceae bacterium TMQ3]TXC68500.1 hypothetical protein FRC91_19335 [Bradymonadales bacterium TMQ1]
MSATLFDVRLPATIQAQPAKRIAEFIRHVDQRCSAHIDVPIYGSVAITLFLADDPNLAYQTDDIDVASTGEDARVFGELASQVSGATLRVQAYSVQQWLVHPDWRQELVDVSELVGTNHIRLLLLHPVDVIITKLLRWHDRDYADALHLKSHFKIEKGVFLERLQGAIECYEPLSDRDNSTLRFALEDLEYS